MKLPTLLCFAWVFLTLALPIRATAAGSDLEARQEARQEDRSESRFQEATPTATLEPTSTPPAQETTRAHGRPTRTPRPTSTPLKIPPPSNLDTNNMMIAFGVVAVIIIVAGLLINRDRSLG